MVFNIIIIIFELGIPIKIYFQYKYLLTNYKYPVI